jgi:hypothetical protein
MLSFRRFVAMLLATVSKSGRCFQNGAFVINVSGVEHEAMALVMQKGGRKRALQKTHDVFMRQGAWNAHRRDPTNGATIRALTPQLDFSLDDGFHACGARKRVALTYLFRITSAASSETYMYLKLETHPTRSLGHTRDAFQRYVLKKPQRGSLSMPTRRENSFKNMNHDIDPEMLHADARAWGAAGAGEYDSKYRTGREMYIPSSVAALLFK